MSMKKGVKASSVQKIGVQCSMVRKIISGGQTGADRAALDFAIQHGIPHGGWIPSGREAEDGPLPERYQLEEMPTADYSERTKQNVIDSDGTVIISHGTLTGGSAFTLEVLEKQRGLWLHLDMENLQVGEAAAHLLAWLALNRIEVLNVAGPCQSEDPKIYKTTCEVLQAALSIKLLG